MGGLHIFAVWLAGAALMLAAGSAARAQVMTALSADTARTTTLAYGLGGQVGYFKSSGADVGAIYVGAVGRVRIGSAIAAEATLGYRGKETFDFGVIGGNNLSAQVSAIPVTVSLLVRLPIQGTLATYVIGGAGLYFVSVDYSAAINQVVADETVTRGALHLGGGAEFPITASVGIHADYRYLFLGSVFTSNSTFNFSDQNYGGSQWTAGLVVYF